MGEEPELTEQQVPPAVAVGVARRAAKSSGRLARMSPMAARTYTGDQAGRGDGEERAEETRDLDTGEEREQRDERVQLDEARLDARRQHVALEDVDAEEEHQGGDRAAAG